MFPYTDCPHLNVHPTLRNFLSAGRVSVTGNTIEYSCNPIHYHVKEDVMIRITLAFSLLFLYAVSAIEYLASLYMMPPVA